ncbi:MAG: efflux RND transporter periplasmic adaptor subunit [Oryzomonas sp.]|uniref:efflux RND transporter periplasmic adaptor subunit n=1 Tax=Oryzomonas sp. TaxID=2855186 RepID=UPI00283FB309|nr:efflux RND transporter periplasmic adaptor subunit [Oryzomonas sp.]MDR3581505.1 efflux RND transporter periplasmic adaptor subunit [Oryzomonas sp.]
MKLKVFVRFVCTITIFAASIFIGKALWNRYMNSPWTRDGKVRADVINVAADVSGIVVRVAVKDNQLVHKGDMLFTVDRERYALALSQAKARLASSKAQMVMKEQEAERRDKLDGVVVSTENRENARSQADSAEALYQEAVAAVDTAKLNLNRTQVRAPVDGYISNLNVHTGDFATAGAAKLAIIDKNSFWVYGYFEETKLHLLHVGDPVEIRLLGNSPALKGHIESMSSGISDHDNPAGRELLSDVNPIFNWVRLAQRVPVRIKVDQLPKGVQLVAGTTCTVIARSSLQAQEQLKSNQKPQM